MPELTDNSQRFLRWFTVAVALVLAASAVINTLVNPYGLFPVAAIQGVSAVKVRAGQQREVFKVANTARLEYATLIIGNSRAEIGFDPLSSAWPGDSGGVYNFAQAGSNLRSY